MSKKNKNTEPQYYLSPINTNVLNYRVYIMNAKEKLLYFFMLLAIGGVVGLIFYGGLFKKEGEATIATYISNVVVFTLVGLIAVKIFMPTLNESLRKKRISKLRFQFRDFLSSLSNSMSSGMNVNDSLLNACKDLEGQYSSDAYIVIETKELIGNVQNNIELETALKSFGDRSGIEDIMNFAIVFSTCYRTGGNLKEVIRRTANVISEKLAINDEIETKITSNKMQMSIMNVIPIFIVFMMRTMSAEFAESFASIIGVIVTTVAVGFFIAAYKVGQKIMDIKG